MTINLKRVYNKTVRYSLLGLVMGIVLINVPKTKLTPHDILAISVLASMIYGGIDVCNEALKSKLVQK